MKKEFFKYFFLTYFVLIAPVATMIVVDEKLSWQEKTGITLLIPLVMTLFLAPLFYWLTPKLKVRHRKRRLKKRFFKEFIEKHQFQISTLHGIFGFIDDYLVIISADYNEFQNQKWIEIQIIFNPKRKDEYISHSFLNRMIRKYEGKNVTWHINSVLIKQLYVLKMPKYDAIHPLLKRCISDLKGYYIEPISHSEWERMIPETQEYFNKLEKL